MFAEVSISNTNGNLTYDTVHNWCITNTSQATMIVCTLNKSILNPSTIYFKVWIVAYGTTIVDTIIGTPVSVTTSNVAIQPVAYDFMYHYFALVD